MVSVPSSSRTTSFPSASRYGPTAEPRGLPARPPPPALGVPARELLALRSRVLRQDADERAPVQDGGLVLAGEPLGRPGAGTAPPSRRRSRPGHPQHDAPRPVAGRDEDPAVTQGTGDGAITVASNAVELHSSVPRSAASAETPTIPPMAAYTYVRTPPIVVVTIEEWDICSRVGVRRAPGDAPGGEVHAHQQRLARRTRRSPPAPPSTSGHCPVYQSGTSVPCSRTRSIPQRSSPVRASQHITWQLGPMVTTYLPLTAGTVREMPWLRFRRTVYQRRQISLPSSREKQRRLSACRASS